MSSKSVSESTVQSSKVKSSFLDHQRKKFIVNGELTLNGNPVSGLHEVTVNLTTGKGANYFAGVIRINPK